MWSRIKTLIIKELLAVWHDKSSRFALIAPPVIQLLLLANAATLEVKHVPIAILNQDSGWYSQELIQRVQGSPYVSHVLIVHDREALHRAIDTQKALIALQFQPDFSRRALAGSTPVQMLVDGRKSNSGQIAAGYVRRIIQDFNSELNAARGQPSGASVTTVFRSWFNPTLDYLLYNVPCLVAVLSMILSLMVTALSVAREREMGTFDQLLVSPLQPWEILVGKAIPAFIIGVGETSFIMILGMVIFGVPFTGSLFLFYFSMIVFVAAMVGVGLFISAISHTQQQAHMGIFVFMMPTMLLSGFSTPVENMVEWLQPTSWLMPLTYFLVIVKGIFLKDMPAMDVLALTWPMALMALVTLSAAGWMFSRRLE